MRKISAHYVFPVTSRPLKNGILILDNNGEIIDIIDTYGQLREEASLEFYNGILVPGFINAHCHLELSHLKNVIEPGQGLVSFIGNITNKRDIELSKATQGALAADIEMKNNGIVAVGDIVNSNLTYNLKKKSSIFYHSFIEIFALESGKVKDMIEKGKQLMLDATFLKLPCSLTVHSPYSVSEALFSFIKKQKKSILSLHLLESREEKLLFENKTGELLDKLLPLGFNLSTTGTSSVDFIIKQLPLDQPVLFVHNTFAQQNDIVKIKKNFLKPYFVLCPKSNLYIENQLPDIEMMIENHCLLALGTDSLASNDRLSILEEMKVLQDHYCLLSFDELLRFATINGAEALEITHRYGSFEKGKKPGVNLIADVNLNTFKLSASSKVIALA